MKTKAQMIGQIFIYILAVVMVAFILLYGYSAIKTFKDRAEQVAFIKFKTDLESTVKSVSFDYGTVKKAEFLVPSGYKEVCFIDLNKPTIPDDPVIEDSVKSGVEKNVFLVAQVAEESFYVGNITVKDPCMAVKGGKIKIRLEGKGNYAAISEWG